MIAREVGRDSILVRKIGLRFVAGVHVKRVGPEGGIVLETRAFVLDSNRKKR